MSEEIMRNNLLTLAQTYATAKGHALSTVSKEIHGKHDFLGNYLAGTSSPSVKTYWQMVNRLRAGWPKKTPWPDLAGIPKLGKKVDEGFAAG